MPEIRVHYASGKVGKKMPVTEGFLLRLLGAVNTGKVQSISRVEVIR